MAIDCCRVLSAKCTQSFRGPVADLGPQTRKVSPHPDNDALETQTRNIFGCFTNNPNSRKGGWNARVPEHAYNFLESVLRAISDIQILLALALGLSVVVFGVCRTLQYQLNISVNLLLLACTSYLQTLGLTRHYWRSWLASMAALLRLLAVVGIYFCFGWILAIQNTFRSEHQFVAQRMPRRSQTDSAVFLKAACFLDPNFQNNTFVALDEAERTHIGLQDNDGPAAEWVLGILLAVVTTLVLIISIPFFMRRFPRQSKKNTVLHKIYYAFIWIPCAVVFGYSCSTVSGLRSWVSKSGWLQSGERGSPLDGVRGFGQTAAVRLFWV